MKQVHPNYTFVASTKTITLTGLNIAQDQLLLITNATRGVIYYNFASSSHRAEVTAGANTTVVLADASTTGHANEDQLVIHYDDQLSTQAIAGTVTANLSTTDYGEIENIRIGTDSIDAKLTSVAVGSLPAISGTVTANAGTGTFAVSAASLPLPSGAATSANQATANTSLSSIETDLGAPADSAASADTGTFSLISLFKRLLQRITALIPSNLTVTSTRLLVDGSGVTQPISGTVTANLAPQASGPIIQIDSAIPSDPKYATIVGGFDTGAGESRALRLGSNGEMIVQDPALIARSGGSVGDSVQNIQVIGGRTGGGGGSSSYAPASIDGNGGLQVGVKWIDTNSGNQTRDPSQQTPFPVQIISATSLPLPSGAATSASQATANTSLSSIDSKLPTLSSGRVPVDIQSATLSIDAAGVEIKNDTGNPIPVSGTVTANVNLISDQAGGNSPVVFGVSGADVNTIRTVIYSSANSSFGNDQGAPVDSENPLPISGTVTANVDLSPISNAFKTNNEASPDTGVQISWWDDDADESRLVRPSQPLPISGTVSTSISTGSFVNNGAQSSAIDCSGYDYLVQHITGGGGGYTRPIQWSNDNSFWTSGGSVFRYNTPGGTTTTGANAHWENLGDVLGASSGLFVIPVVGRYWRIGLGTGGGGSWTHYWYLHKGPFPGILEEAIGPRNAGAASTDTGDGGLISLFKRLLQRITTLVPANLTVSSTRLLVDGSGVTQPVSGTVTANAGTGSFTVAQSTHANLKAQAQILDSSGNQISYIQAGTAGSPSANVLSVQGVASGTAIPVSYSSGTFAVSASSLPLPAGASTAANQATTNSNIGSIIESAATTDTSASGLNGLFKRLLQRITTLIPANLTVASTRLLVDGSGVTQPVSGPLTDAQLRASVVSTTSRGATGMAAVATFTSTTSAEIRASEANRKLLTIFNEGAGDLHVLYGNGTASSTNFTVKVSAGDFLEIEKYTGRVMGIFLNGGTARVTEIT